MEKSVTIYSTGCPKCRVLESKLNAKGIRYNTVNDVSEIMEKGFSSVPMLEVGNEFFDFSSANNWVNAQ